MKSAKTKHQWLFQVNEIISAMNALDNSLQHGSALGLGEVGGALRCIDKNKFYDLLDNLNQVSEFIQKANENNTN